MVRKALGENGVPHHLQHKRQVNNISAAHVVREGEPVGGVAHVPEVEARTARPLRGQRVLQWLRGEVSRAFRLEHVHLIRVLLFPLHLLRLDGVE